MSHRPRTKKYRYYLPRSINRRMLQHLLAWGVKFGQYDRAHKYRQWVELPEGWTIMPGDRRLKHYIVYDNVGNRRAYIYWLNTKGSMLLPRIGAAV